jgi:hypothetical protein
MSRSPTFVVTLALGMLGAIPGTASARPVQVFLTGGDLAHLSSTPPPTMSAHGWWVLVKGKATRAMVTVQLQQKKGSGWVNVGTPGRKIVPSSRVSGRKFRATGRARCHRYKRRTYTYRSVVDVDIIGYADTPDRLVTSAVTARCSVLGRDP